MKQRLRVTFGVAGPLRYISHLEQMGVWERAARRAGIPLAYSQGYNPRPRMQIAAALPVGFAAERELVDMWLEVEEPISPRTAGEALSDQTPPGLTVVDVEEIDLARPAMQTQVCAAEYAVWVEAVEPAQAVQDRVAALLAAESLPRERRGRAYDLRPLIEALCVAPDLPAVTLLMGLTTLPGATGRPEEVLDELRLADRLFRVTRRRLALECEP
jgi:radical SAM-linked protein